MEICSTLSSFNHFSRSCFRPCWRTGLQSSKDSYLLSWPWSNRMPKYCSKGDVWPGWFGTLWKRRMVSGVLKIPWKEKHEPKSEHNLMSIFFKKRIMKSTCIRCMHAHYNISIRKNERGNWSRVQRGGCDTKAHRNWSRMLQVVSAGEVFAYLTLYTNLRKLTSQMNNNGTMEKQITNTVPKWFPIWL